VGPPSAPEEEPLPDAAVADEDALGADELAARLTDWSLGREAAPDGTRRTGAGARTNGTDTGDGKWTGGSDGVETVGVETVGVDIAGVVPKGVETVGTVTPATDTLGTDTLGTETIGTVRAELECGSMPTRSTPKPDRIQHTAILRALAAIRPGRPLSRTPTSLQPPCMARKRYPSPMPLNRTRFESIGRLRHARGHK
jgi:hypothetical protein